MAGSGSRTGPPDLRSTINGHLGSLRVASDIAGASIKVIGNIGNAVVGGSVLGADMDNSGMIYATGDMGALWIKGDVMGGTGIHTGLIEVEGSLTGGRIDGVYVGVTVDGSVRHGDGFIGGYVSSGGDMAAVRVGGGSQINLKAVLEREERPGLYRTRAGIRRASRRKPDVRLPGQEAPLDGKRTSGLRLDARQCGLNPDRVQYSSGAGQEVDGRGQGLSRSSS